MCELPPLCSGMGHGRDIRHRLHTRWREGWYKCVLRCWAVVPVQHSFWDYVPTRWWYISLQSHSFPSSCKACVKLRQGKHMITNTAANGCFSQICFSPCIHPSQALILYMWNITSYVWICFFLSRETLLRLTAYSFVFLLILCMSVELSHPPCISMLGSTVDHGITTSAVFAPNFLVNGVKNHSISKVFVK